MQWHQLTPTQVTTRTYNNSNWKLLSLVFSHEVFTVVRIKNLSQMPAEAVSEHFKEAVPALCYIQSITRAIGQEGWHIEL